MSHLTRQEVPTKWPIERKGTAYIVKPKFSTQEGVPLLIILREMLDLAQNRREAKRIIHSKQILINQKVAKEEKNTVMFLDTVTVVPSKKNYRLQLSEKGRFYLNEIEESEAKKKISKIINKTMLKGKKLQLNLNDGRNFLSDIKAKVNDSLIVNFKENKIEKCLPFKEKAKVIVFSGKHIGKEGEIVQIDQEKKMAKVKSEDKEINILINQLIVTE